MKPEILRKRGTGKAALDEVRKNPKRWRAAMAADLGVSEPMVAWARRILRSGIPELIAAVEDGRVALYMAARICRWDPRLQQEAIAILGMTDGTTLSLSVFTRCAKGNAAATLDASSESTAFDHAESQRRTPLVRSGDPGSR
jgi:hypothetical protein